MLLPLVSVIVPNFNHAPYLQQRIDTILFQTYKNFEIILLDDCSTDHSRELIDLYKQNSHFTHIVYNDTNSGSAFRQWVKGVALCKGEYVWFAESDDWCEPTFLETVMNGIVSNDNCVLGYCQSYYVENNNIIWQSKHEKLNDLVKGEDFISNYMISGTAIYNASMAVWRKDIFEKISSDFLHFKLCGDWLFWIEVSKFGNVFISGKSLNYFRKHPDNVSGKGVSSGNSFVEELTMFMLLYQKGLISEGNLFKSFKSEYVQFKAVEKELDREKSTQIKDIFFKDIGIGKRLKNYYSGFYSRYIITKLINKIFARFNHRAL